MHNETHILEIRVNDEFTLNAGWWEESLWSDGVACRIIHPPEQTMYDQVLHYLETSSKDAKNPPRSSLDFGEVAIATMAVCIRWGSYFSVLTDNTKPIWPMTEQKEISFIDDDEMARINIESSAALAQWIDLMRADDKLYRKLVKVAVRQLPMPLDHIDSTVHHKLYRIIGMINSTRSRRNFIDGMAEYFGQGWIARERDPIAANPTRALANRIINTFWRNKSSIESIHAGKSVVRPLLQRRITPEQEQALVRTTTEWFVPSLHAVYNVINKRSEDSWFDQVLALSLGAFRPPDTWSMHEYTCEVVLLGAEPL